MKFEIRSASLSEAGMRRGVKKKSKYEPVHPGEILNEEFLVPGGISRYRLAKDISVAARRINEIVLGKRGITADTALRQGFYFNTSPDFWMNLQSRTTLKRGAIVWRNRSDVR